MAPSKVYPCRGCNKNITNKQLSIQCVQCEYWAHPDCITISPEFLKILINKEQGASWTCETCIVVRGKFLKEVNTLYAKMDAMETKMCEVAKEVSENANQTKENSRQIEQLKASIDRESILQESGDSIFKELRDRKSREDKLILHNVPELAGERKTEKEKKDWDYKLVSEIICVLNCQIDIDKEAVFLTRLGEKSSDPEKPRPIRIMLKSKEKRNLILDCAPNLRNSKFDEVSIAPDLTMKQRKEEDRLRREADKLNKEMSEEDAKNWEHVLVGRRGERILIKRRKKDMERTKKRGREREGSSPEQRAKRK